MKKTGGLVNSFTRKGVESVFTVFMGVDQSADVYQAGQWAVSPAGIPTCILTSKLAVDRVYK